MREYLQWQVGYSDTKDDAVQEYVPAKVPGAVQLDFKEAKNMPDYNFGRNFLEYQWMEEKFFRYRGTIDELREDDTRKVYFVSKGIDYQFEIYLNGELVHEQEGMYTPVYLDLTDGLHRKKGESTIEILIFPIPKRKGVMENSREEASQCVKPPASYNWDWHPRLVPSGIWQETYLEYVEEMVFETEVLGTLSEDLQSASFSFQADVTGGTPSWSLFDPDGKLLYTFEGTKGGFSLENPRLWWCNGMGEPELYTWEMTLGDIKRSGHIGLRRVTMEMNPGTWEEISAFPKTRSHPPATICLNGKNIFCKGSNWVMPEIFYGATTREVYKTQLTLVKEANFNILRCWGGANINKEDFYELCDELGIMVWQEFPLACNNYIGSDSYLEVLEQEAVSILLQLRSHACICLWCGGNELFNDWSGMTDQSLALRLLNKLCYEYSRDIPFNMTSPLDGMAHGCYLFVYPDGREVYEAMNGSHYTAYTEFGVPSVANEECLRMALPEEEIFPLNRTENTVAHHAYDAWFPGDTWCGVETIEKYFGKQENLGEFLEKSQWLQSEGYKAIFEEARRQKPYCSMALNWCLNEPWPCVANNSLLCFPSSPKPAYYAVQKSCRSVLASARLFRFSYKAGETFEADLYMLNDAPHDVAEGRVKVELQIGDTVLNILDWAYETLPAGQNLEGPRVRAVLPDVEAKEMTLRLVCGEYSSEYRLQYAPAEKKKSGLAILNM